MKQCKGVGMVFDKGFTQELRISLLEHCKRTQAGGVRRRTERKEERKIECWLAATSRD